MKKIAIFASGTGTNAERIIRYFQDSQDVAVVFVLCNKPDAPVLQKAESLHVPTRFISKADFEDGTLVLRWLADAQVDFIVLAGFLLFIPHCITADYTKRIINIHPSLLPKHGGKGMYGLRVHQAVLDAHETQSGITIHYVNDEYDAGDIILQAQCPVLPSDTPDTLAQRVHQLEYEWLPRVVEKIVTGSSNGSCE